MAVRSCLPAYATVRRYWPNQPDLSGRLIRQPGGWDFAFIPGGGGDIHLRQTDPIRPGICLMITGADGVTLPFRVHVVPDHTG